MVTMAASPAAMACLYQMIVWPFWHYRASLPCRNDETPSIFFSKGNNKKNAFGLNEARFFAVVFFKHLVDFFVCSAHSHSWREKGTL